MPAGQPNSEDPILTDEERQAFDVLTSGLKLAKPPTRERLRMPFMGHTVGVSVMVGTSLACLVGVFALFAYSPFVAALLWVGSVLALVAAVNALRPRAAAWVSTMNARREARVGRLIEDMNRRRNGDSQ